MPHCKINIILLSFGIEITLDAQAFFSLLIVLFNHNKRKFAGSEMADFGVGKEDKAYNTIHLGNVCYYLRTKS